MKFLSVFFSTERFMEIIWDFDWLSEGEMVWLKIQYNTNKRFSVYILHKQ